MTKLCANQTHYLCPSPGTGTRRPSSPDGQGWPGSSAQPLSERTGRCPDRWFPQSPAPAALWSAAPPGSGSFCPSFCPRTRPRPPGAAGLWPGPAGLEPGWGCRRVVPQWGWDLTGMGRSELAWVQRRPSLRHHQRTLCCRSEEGRWTRWVWTGLGSGLGCWAGVWFPLAGFGDAAEVDQDTEVPKQRQKVARITLVTNLKIDCLSTRKCDVCLHGWSPKHCFYGQKRSVFYSHQDLEPAPVVSLFIQRVCFNTEPPRVVTTLSITKPFIVKD